MFCDENQQLRKKAREIRRHIVEMVSYGEPGHLGGALSIVDILVTLYFCVMHHDPTNPDKPDRDRLILSKGHAGLALYAVLAEAGYLPAAELSSFKKLGSRLQGHPDRVKLPPVEMSTGSLGQGLSVGVGLALALKLDGIPRSVYVLMGDGELDEGQVWEAAAAASHLGLDNLVGIVDRNNLQLDGPTESILRIEPLADKWTAFGWHVTEANGHDFEDLKRAFASAREVSGRPTVILARTVKGKGISFAENRVEFHSYALSPEEKKQALSEIDAT